MKMQHAFPVNVATLFYRESTCTFHEYTLNVARCIKYLILKCCKSILIYLTLQKRYIDPGRPYKAIKYSWPLRAVD